MKFVVNTTNLQTGGALQIAISLLYEWNRNVPEHEFHVFLSPQMSSLIDRDTFLKHIQFYHFSKNPTSGLWDTLFFRKQLAKTEKKINPHAILTVFGPALWKPKAPHLVGFANGYYLFNDSKFIRKRLSNNLLIRIGYNCRRWILFNQLKKESNQYWVETKSAQEKLAFVLQENPSKIHIIGNTYGHHLEDTSNYKPSPNKIFTFLFLSAYYPHKNFEIIPQVIQILRKRGISCQFIVTLSEHIYHKIFDGESYGNYLKNIGFVKPIEIASAYAQCDAVFMPSLLETFSANFPEAMKMRKPILCSKLNFAQEICGNGALYFDPENVIDISDKIEEIIENKELRLALIEASLSRLEQMETALSRAEKLFNLLVQMPS